MRLEFEPTTAPPPATAATDAKGHELEAREALGLGIKAAQSGDRQSARSLLLRAASLDPRSENAWLWLASISEYPEELMVFLNNVLDINPCNERALEWMAATKTLLSKTFVQRGTDASSEGRGDLAIECFNKALEYDQANAMAWMWLASLAESDEGKITYLEKVLEIEPENNEARIAISNARRAINDRLLFEARSTAVAGRKNEAFALIDAIIAESPDCADAWILKAHLVDGFEEKLKCFDSVLAFDAGNPAATAGRESILAIMGTVGDLHAFVPKGDPESTLANLESETKGRQEEVHKAEEICSPWEEPESLSESPVGHIPGQLVEEIAVFEPAGTDGVLAVETTAGARIEPVPEMPEFDLNDSATGFAFVPSITPGDERDPSSDAADETLAAGDEGDVFIPAPAVPLPSLPGQELTGYETRVTPAETATKRPAMQCAFCATENPAEAVCCGFCVAVLGLSDLEMLINNEHADRAVIARAIESIEKERTHRALSEPELTMLGVGHLNLRNLELGYAYLQEASHLNPNNVVLGRQVNALLIRLEEIRQQEEAHGKLTRGKRILVVDDSPTVRKLISGKLEKCGHEVICSADGVDAIEQMTTIVPDLVLLDITMPRMDGYQVCKMIRSNSETKDIPVVMISGKDGFFDKVRGRMAGTTGYITKPFGPETLMKAVEMYLGGHVDEGMQK